MATALQERELHAGSKALARAAWADARERFAAALLEGESPEALLGLGIATRALFDGEAALAAHERGYRLTAEARERRWAARFALELALDCLNFRGPAEARGWLERAGRLLEGLEPGFEQGLLAYFRARYALSIGHDPESARRFAAEGAALARAGDAADGELVCRALEGLALVAQGRVEEGMPLLDEAAAAAVAGEVRDPQLVEVICCHLIDACQRVRDFDRAGEWCRRVEAIAARFGDAEMFATCRTLYGEVLLWQGAWGDAEATLTAVCRQLAGVQPKAIDGLVRLSELRRRQGRREEAAALLEQCGDHRQAAVVRSSLALDEGDPAAAVEDAERYLRRVGKPDRLERVPALELLTAGQLALGNHVAAEASVAELERTAARVGTRPLRAAALLARGRLQASVEPEAAPALLDDAADLFRESGVRYEAALARHELAAALRSLGRDSAAEHAEQAARGEFTQLGVTFAAPSSSHRLVRGGLTRREREVLRLLAQGRSNDEIAAELVLSVRTVESHVAGVYTKIGVSGRTARAAATAYALANGLA
jgi:LuxR family transcriptional regulator, maltose regulon positive regulatory protein